MIVSRAFWISLFVGVALVGALSACATQDEPAAPAAAAQCYWLSNEGAGWVARPDLADAELCFEMDSCSGGVGLSGGGCYKWATAADAPAVPWTDLDFTPLSREEPPAQEVSERACYRRSEDGRSWAMMDGYREAQCFLSDPCSGGMRELESEQRTCFKWAIGPDAPALPWSATLTNPQLAADVPPPEDIYEGSFEAPFCFAEGCEPVTLRVNVATRLYRRPDATARVVGAISAAECVRVRNERLRSAPQRGVVLETYREFTAGDVIYGLADEGEGTYSVWRRGEYLSASYYLAVRWDAGPRTVDPRVGHWFEFSRSNGQRGWALDAEVTHEQCTVGRR